MKKLLKLVFSFLVLISLGLLAANFLFPKITELLGLKSRAGLRATSTPPGSVYVDGQKRGDTPYQDEHLLPGNYLVKLATSSGVWQGWIKLNPGTTTLINRELLGSAASSSGEILTLKEGQGVVITSSPTGAQVELDGKSVGQTPTQIKDISVGEHNFLLSKEGYLKRSMAATVPERMMLTIDVDLATAKVSVAEEIAPLVGGGAAFGVVKKTPTNFLRVRQGPSTKSREVSRVPTGEKLEILAEAGSWLKVRTGEGQEGYVSGVYVKREL